MISFIKVKGMFIMLSFATYTKLINFIVKENHSEHTLVGPLRY